MGTMFFAAAANAIIIAKPATTTRSSSYLPFLIIIVLFGLFYVLILRPQRARQRQAMQRQTTATPGSRIRTTAGIYGTIVSGDDRDVVVEVAPGVQIKMLRRAIMDVVPEDDPSAGTGTTGFGTAGAGGQSTQTWDGKDQSEKDKPTDDWDIKDQNI